MKVGSDESEALVRTRFELKDRKQIKKNISNRSMRLGESINRD